MPAKVGQAIVAAIDLSIALILLFSRHGNNISHETETSEITLIIDDNKNATQSFSQSEKSKSV
jgi:hypothetical protein